MSMFSLLRQFQLTILSKEQFGQYCLIHMRTAKEINWLPGSYARFSIPKVQSGEKIERALTIASLPDEERLTVLFKNKGDVSEFKRTFSELSSGQIVTMRYLYSNLKLINPELPQLFFVSDVGIAAARPMIIKLLKQEPSTRIELNHLDIGCHVFDQELLALSHNYYFFDYSNIGQSDSQNVNLDEAVAKYGNEAVYYLVGLPSHVKEWGKKLKARGIGSKHIKKEPFIGLK